MASAARPQIVGGGYINLQLPITGRNVAVVHFRHTSLLFYCSNIAATTDQAIAPVLMRYRAVRSIGTVLNNN